MNSTEKDLTSQILETYGEEDISVTERRKDFIEFSIFLIRKLGFQNYLKVCEEVKRDPEFFLRVSKRVLDEYEESENSLNYENLEAVKYDYRARELMRQGPVVDVLKDPSSMSPTTTEGTSRGRLANDPISMRSFGEDTGK